MIQVLYVDDEPDLLDITRLFLEATGEFSLDIAVSAQLGLPALQKKKYDAVVSDFQMPGMDGIEFLKVVRSKFDSVPFILFTGRGREEVVIRAIDNGVDFYLQKGGDPRAQFVELAHKIRQAVARRTAEQSRVGSEKRLADIINSVRDLDLAGKKLDTDGLGGFAIIADPLLQKVFFNLVDNALRHGGNQLTTIRFSSREDSAGLVLVCEDDGVGIPAHQKELIFERGYGKNTGLGLFFIREILSITGITIRETGEPGRGARFEMLVPKGEYRGITSS